MTNQSPAELQRYLQGINYPVNKDDLVNWAKQNGAPEEVINTIQNFSEEQFGGPQDVIKSLGEGMGGETMGMDDEDE